MSTSNQKQIIQYFLDSKETPKEVGKKFNISAITVRRILKKHEIPNVRGRMVVNNPNKIAKNIQLKVINEYHNGLSIIQISKKYTICQSMIYEILIESGDRKRKNVLDHMEVLDKYKELKSSQKVAEHFSYSKRTILKILKNNNIEKKYADKNIKAYEKVKWENYDILALFHELKTAQKVAEYIGTSVWMIYKQCKKLNIEIPAYRKKTVNIPEEQLINLYFRGLTIKEISKLLKINTLSISERIKSLELSRTLCRSFNFNEIEYEEFKLYSKKARRFTISVRHHCDMKSKPGFHWNHMISLVDGFKRKLPLHILCCPENLELITGKKNLSLGCKSKISIEEIMNKRSILKPLQKTESGV